MDNESHFLVGSQHMGSLLQLVHQRLRLRRYRQVRLHPRRNAWGWVAVCPCNSRRAQHPSRFASVCSSLL